MQKLEIGLFGLGVVGAGIWDMLQGGNKPHMQINRICVQNRNKQRSVPKELLSYDPLEVLDHINVNTIVEAIHEPELAYKVVSRALLQGRNVVTANKKMLARYLPELIDIQEQTGQILRYESAACGSIPIVRILEEHFGGEQLGLMQGIFNGTSNYILTRMFQDNLDLPEALKLAQALGFAESDPSDDIDGEDAKYKLVLLTAHSHGFIARAEEVFNSGIRHIRPADIHYAKQHNCQIRLLPVCKTIQPGKLSLYAIPALLPASNALYYTDNEYNSVQVDGQYAGRQFFTGRGAGSKPTASAIFSDLVALQQGNRYIYHKLRLKQAWQQDDSLELPVYLRFPLSVSPEQMPLLHFENVKREADSWCVTGTSNIGLLKAHRNQLEEDRVFIMQLQ